MAQAIAGPSSAGSSQQRSPPPSQQQRQLKRAADTLKTFATQDAQNVDLADYLNASINQPYKLYLSSPWASLRKVRTLTIPDAVIQASTSAQSFAAQGLFPEIERAWIIIDSQLYLWNYLEGSSSAFESYLHPTQVIQAVALISPKAGVFIDSIKHVLLISTRQSVTVLGLAVETTPGPDSRRELRLYQTDFNLQTSGVVMHDFVATRDGSRVFCRGSDACLYELHYQAKEGWFSSKCSLKNLTSGGLKNLLPGWAGGMTKESLDHITMDHSRSLLYLLHSRQSISVFSVTTGPQSTAPQLITTIKDIYRTASLISPNNASLFRKEEFSIISLQPIRVEESRTVSLLATTSNGVRLYFTNQRSGYRGFPSTSSSLGGGTTLELLYVRPPPASGLNPTTTPPSSASADRTDFPAAQPPLQHLSHALYRDGVFLAAGAYAHENGLDNVLCINRSSSTSTILNNTIVSAGGQGSSSSTGTSSAVVPSSSTAPSAPATASNPADPAELATDVLVQGATWALAEVPRDTGSPASLNPLVRQIVSVPRTFLVLTSTGLTVLVENRPIDLLKDLLERSSATSGPGSSETVGLVEVFKRHGQAQACAMALAIATRTSHLGLSLEALLAVRPANSFPAQMYTVESIMHATRIYFDFGGAPRYEPPPYPHQPITEGRVHLSGKHEGLGVYFARLLGSLWEKDLKSIGSGVGSSSPTSIVGKDLEELRGFVRSHAEAFGIQSKSSNPPNGAGEGDALAHRIEQDSLRALVAYLERTIEALSFVVLLGDFGWDRVISKLNEAIRTKVEQMKFGDLVLEASGPETSGQQQQQQQQQQQSGSTANAEQMTVSRGLVEALIDLHSVSSPNGMDVIADLLQSRCSSFCDANDVRLYKALERMRQAKESPAGPKRDELLRESEALMMRASGHLPFERLEEVVKLWREMDWVGGALQLPLSCANEWDPHGFARAYREDGLPEGDADRRAVYERSMRCYGLVLQTLKSLDERVEAAQREGGKSTEHIESMREMAYSIVQQSLDPLLHEALYDSLLSSGKREQLLDLRTPFLEGYLQQEPLTLSKLELLWQCYTRRGEGASAARVLVGLAESTELDLSLFQRLEYLTLASNNAKSATSGSMHTGTEIGYATVSFVAEIEEKLEVAQVQIEIYRAVGELEDLEDDKKQMLLQELDSALLDISTLYRDFADPLELYDVKILIYHVSDFKDTERVSATWEAILTRAHEEGARRISPERAFERVASVVLELGRRFMSSEFACPLEVLVRNLEQYAYNSRNNRTAIPVGWAPGVLLAASAPPEAVFDVLEGLYHSKADPWQTRGAIVFLLSDVHSLVSSWLSSYLSTSGSGNGDYYSSTASSSFGYRTTMLLTSSSSGRDLSSSLRGINDVNAASSFPAKRLDDALNGYLLTLNSLLGQLRDESEIRLARETVNGFKMVQDRLRSVF